MGQERGHRDEGHSETDSPHSDLRQNPLAAFGRSAFCGRGRTAGPTHPAATSAARWRVREGTWSSRVGARPSAAARGAGAGGRGKSPRPSGRRRRGRGCRGGASGRPSRASRGGPPPPGRRSRRRAAGASTPPTAAAGGGEGAGGGGAPRSRSGPRRGSEWSRRGGITTRPSGSATRPTMGSASSGMATDSGGPSVRVVNSRPPHAKAALPPPRSIRCLGPSISPSAKRIGGSAGRSAGQPIRPSSLWVAPEGFSREGGGVDAEVGRGVGQREKGGGGRVGGVEVRHAVAAADEQLTRAVGSHAAGGARAGGRSMSRGGASGSAGSSCRRALPETA